MSKIIGDWPCSHIPTRQQWAGQDVLTDLPRQLAGNALAMHGHTMAPTTLPSQTPAPPDMVSPATGKMGHTHSGGRDGRPLFRTIASFNCQRLWSAGAGNLYPNSAIMGYSFSGAAHDEEHYEDFEPVPLFIPQCDPLSGAYLRLGVLVQARTTTVTTMQATDTLRVIVENLTADDDVYEDFSFPAAVGVDHMRAFSGNLKMIPGQFNAVRLRVLLDPDSGASTAARTVDGEIMNVELGVYLTENPT